MAHPNDLNYPFIDGQYDMSRSSRTFNTINPATEDVVAEFVQCDQQHVDEAVAAAAAAQVRWYALPASERGARIWRWGEIITQHGEELARLDTIDTGKPITDSLALISKVNKLCQYWAGMADKIWGHTMPVTPGHLSYTRREPHGVIGVITPWNIPQASFVGRAAAAISCGNGVIVKPSEYSPSSALRLAEFSVMAGIPAGLVNVLTGNGEVGAMLSAHPGIGGMSFTGSVASGRKVNVSAANTFKKVILEMGGKSPNIVFADADLDAALRGSVWGVFYNTGQICGAGTRLLVERKIAAEFLQRIKDAASKIRIGDPMDAATQIGPLVCKQQYDRVQSYLEIGRGEAKVEIGGGRPASLGHDLGFYVEPTIFTDVDPTMRIAQEEVFGPILTVLPFDDEDEALALANNVEFGLGATVWTRDSGRLLRMADRLEAGVIWANTMRLSDPALPFGGIKNSGLGSAFADGAVEGYTRVRRVSIRFDDSAPAPGWDL